MTNSSSVSGLLQTVLLAVLFVNLSSSSSSFVAATAERKRSNRPRHPLVGKQSFIQIRTGHINPEDGSKVMKTNQTYYDVDINNGIAAANNLTRGLAVEDPEGANGQIAPQVHNCSYDFSKNKWHIPSPLTFYCDTSASFVLRFELSDWIINEFIDYKMFRVDENWEYTIDITDNNYITPGVVYDSMPAQGDGTGCRQMAYFLDVNPFILSSSPLYIRPTPENGLENPFITFSTRTLIYNSRPPWHPWYSLANWIDIDFFFTLQLNNVGFYGDSPFWSGGRKLLSSSNRQGPADPLPIVDKVGGAGMLIQEDKNDLEDFITQDLVVKKPTKTGVPLLRSNETLMILQGTNDGADCDHETLEPYEHDQRKSRDLLRCFDGFGVVFNTQWNTVGRTDSPTTSLAPTATPQPTAPTASPAPSLSQEPTYTPPAPPTPPVINIQFQNAQEAYGVDGYLCDENLKPLEPLKLPDSDNVMIIVEIGDSVRVCVERNAKSKRDNIYIRYIDAFSFFKWNDRSMRQVAIRPTALPALNGLTEVFCVKGAEKCYFDTYLVGGFFDNSGVVSGSGQATMQFTDETGEYGTRLLSEEGEDSGPPRGEADMTIENGMTMEETARSISIEFAVMTAEDAEIVRLFNAKKETEKSRRLPLIFGIIFLCLFCVISPLIVYGHWWKKNKKEYMLNNKRPFHHEVRVLLQNKFSICRMESNGDDCEEEEDEDIEDIEDKKKQKKNHSVRSCRTRSSRSSRTAATVGSDYSASEHGVNKDYSGRGSRRSSRRTARIIDIEAAMGCESGDSEKQTDSHSTRSSRSTFSRRSKRPSSPRVAKRWLTESDESDKEEQFSDEETTVKSRSRRERRSTDSEEHGSTRSSRSLSSRRSRILSSPAKGKRWLVQESFSDEEQSNDKRNEGSQRSSRSTRSRSRSRHRSSQHQRLSRPRSRSQSKSRSRSRSKSRSSRRSVRTNENSFVMRSPHSPRRIVRKKQGINMEEAASRRMPHQLDRSDPPTKPPLSPRKMPQRLGTIQPPFKSKQKETDEASDIDDSDYEEGGNRRKKGTSKKEKNHKNSKRGTE